MTELDERVCPHCGFVAETTHQEIAHMERAHPEIIEQRLRSAGEQRLADELAARSTGISVCCHAPLEVVSADEGTSHYRCAFCGGPGDPVS